MRRLWTTCCSVIRYAPVLFSSLLATAFLIAAFRSITSPIYLDWRTGKENTFYLYLADGLFRIAWLRCDQPIRLLRVQRSMDSAFTAFTAGQLQGPPSKPIGGVDVVSDDELFHYPISFIHPSAEWARGQGVSWVRSLFEFRWLSLAAAGSGQYSALYRTFLRVPVWALVALLYLYPIVVLWRGTCRKWRKRRRGLCVKCAYDLRGSVSGKCPECGTVGTGQSTIDNPQSTIGNW